MVFSCLAKDEKISYLKSDCVLGQRTEVNVDNFIKMQWKRRVYCPRREIREVTFFNGTENEKITYTEKSEFGKNYMRFVYRQEDKTAIITVVRKDLIMNGDILIKDERIFAPFIKKIGDYILSKNYSL